MLGPVMALDELQTQEERLVDRVRVKCLSMILEVNRDNRYNKMSCLSSEAIRGTFGAFSLRRCRIWGHPYAPPDMPGGACWQTRRSKQAPQVALRTGVWGPVPPVDFTSNAFDGIWTRSD